MVKMGSLQRCLLILFLLPAIILLISPSASSDKDDEDRLFKGINSYRASLNLTALEKNDNAACIADELADRLEQKRCTAAATGPGSMPEPQIWSDPGLVRKCDVDRNKTRDAVVMQVCVPDLHSDLVLGNFTRTRYSKYLNDSKYTAAGIGSEDDWIVVVLGTGAPAGSLGEAESGAGGVVVVSSIVVAFFLAVVLSVFLS